MLGCMWRVFKIVGWMVLGGCVCVAQTPVAAKVREMRAAPGVEARMMFESEGFAPTTEVYADVLARFSRAEAAKGGELWLEVSASTAAGEHLTLRIPLANTGDAYGEERSCKAAGDGRDALVYTAGLDEKNFVDFAAAGKDKEFHLLLNKYLCRALAAPFHCGQRTVMLPGEWTLWRVAKHSGLVLSAGAVAAVQVLGASVMQTTTAFDRTRCAVVAPSNGLCCVGGKTTAWHCGVAPTGKGWHQVSGECYHQETGGSCKDGDVLTAAPR
jgi:hypothetical protein